MKHGLHPAFLVEGCGETLVNYFRAANEIYDCPLGLTVDGFCLQEAVTGLAFSVSQNVVLALEDVVPATLAASNLKNLVDLGQPIRDREDARLKLLPGFVTAGQGIVALAVLPDIGLEAFVPAFDHPIEGSVCVPASQGFEKKGVLFESSFERRELLCLLEHGDFDAKEDPVPRQGDLGNDPLHALKGSDDVLLFGTESVGVRGDYEAPEEGYSGFVVWVPVENRGWHEVAVRVKGSALHAAWGCTRQSRQQRADSRGRSENGPSTFSLATWLAHSWEYFSTFCLEWIMPCSKAVMGASL